MDIFAQLVEKIVREQEVIIGSIALEQARSVVGLEIDLSNHQINFHGDKSEIVDKLIEKYRELFGQASVEACKDAASGIISQVPKDQIPHLLK